MTCLSLRQAEQLRSALPQQHTASAIARDFASATQDEAMGVSAKVANPESGVSSTRASPDHISRGSIKLLFGQVLLDEREAIYRGLVRTARGENGPELQLRLVNEMGDGIEGRPIQVTQKSTTRVTYFVKDEGPPAITMPDQIERQVASKVVTVAPPGSPIAGEEITSCNRGSPHGAHSLELRPRRGPHRSVHGGAGSQGQPPRRP